MDIASSLTAQMEDLPLFVVPDIGLTSTLSVADTHHAIRVLRLQPGAKVYVTDGAGGLYLAEIKSLSGKELPVELIKTLPSGAKHFPELHLAVTPLKNADRTEWLLEKLVEIGLSSFDLIITERTIRKKINLDRLENVMLSAMKQSRKCFLTQLREFSSVREFCVECQAQQKFIAYCGDEYPKQELANVFRPGLSAIMLIGPEGDFTPKEVELAVGNGFVPVALGPERLRSETAALYAGTLHHVINTQRQSDI